MITICGLEDEDFLNYRKPSMFIAFPNCTFKCGLEYCQNAALRSARKIEVNENDLVRRYASNPITEAIIFGALEPFDSFDDVVALIKAFRNAGIDDDIVIYSGYEKDEIKDKIDALRAYKDIVVKFGRYQPDKEQRYDEVLGVNLASPNQYAEKIS